jgi:hypothetical protein
MAGIPSPRSTPLPFRLVQSDSWPDRAACADHPTLLPHTWDDESDRDTARSRPAQIAAAIAACRTCPVAMPCLADVDLDYDRGVRGGVDLRELLAARRQVNA